MNQGCTGAVPVRLGGSAARYLARSWYGHISAMIQAGGAWKNGPTARNGAMNAQAVATACVSRQVLATAARRSRHATAARAKTGLATEHAFPVEDSPRAASASNEKRWCAPIGLSIGANPGKLCNSSCMAWYGRSATGPVIDLFHRTAPRPALRLTGTISGHSVEPADSLDDASGRALRHGPPRLRQPSPRCDGLSSPLRERREGQCARRHS